MLLFLLDVLLRRQEVVWSVGLALLYGPLCGEFKAVYGRRSDDSS
jgi:hypothetical protein